MLWHLVRYSLSAKAELLINKENYLRKIKNLNNLKKRKKVVDKEHQAW